jgi:tetratricopeptide (TPR) repeat protein
MKKHGRARFLNAIFIMLVAIPTFTVFCLIGISGQTVQQKQDPVRLFDEGKDLIDQKKYAEAAKGFERVVEINPTHKHAYTNLSYMYLELGRYKDAAISARKEIPNYPENALAAHVSVQPAPDRVYGMTPRRLVASVAAVLGLIGVVIGGLALARPAGRFGTASGRLGAIVALAAGLIGMALGGLVVATAKGGLGTGNGLGGAVVALVVGLITIALGGLALGRTRRTG